MNVDLAALAGAPARVEALERQVAELRALVESYTSGKGLPRFATQAEICNVYGISKRTFYAWIDDPRMPFGAAVSRVGRGERKALRVDRERWQRAWEACQART